MSETTTAGLFVGDLSICVESQILKQLFDGFGTITKAGLRMDKCDYQITGYGFVYFSTFGEAEAAMKALQGTLMLGRRLRYFFINFNSLQFKISSYFTGYAQLFRIFMIHLQHQLLKFILVSLHVRYKSDLLFLFYFSLFSVDVCVYFCFFSTSLTSYFVCV